MRQAQDAERRLNGEAAAAALEPEHGAKRQLCLARTQHAIAILAASMSKAERRAAIDRLRAEEAAELHSLDAAHRESVRKARRFARQRVRTSQRLQSRALTTRQRHERVHLAILLKSAGVLRRSRRRPPPLKSVVGRVLVRSLTSSSLPPA